jgi:hypothetical protein
MKLFLAGLFILGIPAYFMIRILRQQKAKQKRQLELGIAYDNMTRRHKLAIEHSDLLKGKVIALDRKNKKLLLIDHNQTSRQEEVISLLGIEACRIKEEKDAKDQCTGKIFLEMKHKWNEKITRFCFYDDAYDPLTDLPSLARRARYWKNRIDLHKYPGHVCLELEYVL